MIQDNCSLCHLQIKTAPFLIDFHLESARVSLIFLVKGKTNSKYVVKRQG